MHDEATQRQVSASDPRKSTWLSANAGSGKTKVLTDRVARLLLSGVPPQNILCLTYTNAAATEMQNRLFSRLGEWAMKADADLFGALLKLGGDVRLDAEELRRARTLFASALETPGGLRIQTIHSFCASLLRRFPLEAGVSPLFMEMDERAASRLRDEILDAMALKDDPAVMRAVARYVSADGLSGLAANVVKNAPGFQPAATTANIWKSFGLPADFSREQLVSTVFSGSEAEMLEKSVSILGKSPSKKDQDIAAKLSVIDLGASKFRALEALIPIFVFNENAKTNPFKAKTSTVPTAQTKKAYPEFVTELHEFMRRVEAARESLVSIKSAEKTDALHRFAAEFLPLYAAKKEARGWMDFDDFIRKARQLLSNPLVAEWVLFRLDGGLDHILIDEAQDTNPEQWQIVKLLAKEFTTGRGTRPDTERTIFVVGDLKQSIYSFQGADPRAFEQMRLHFDGNLSNVGKALFLHSLEHSFRSSGAILDVVDSVFKFGNSTGLGGKPSHQTFLSGLAGRVDVWPIIPVSEKPKDKEWYDPTDKPGRHDHQILLANSIASQIEEMVRTGSIPDDLGGFRRIKYGDFLILVQSRSPLFHHIIRACKSLGLPIAGADRLKVAAELAVKDIKALLKFLSFPDDDLSLACALRSPLFQLSEGELFTIANPRQKTTLWSALRSNRERYSNIVGVLDDLLGRNEFINPFELIERMLIRHNGRLNLISRLGPEAEVGIDAILSLALEFERSNTPSLTGFVVWLDSDDVVVKRQTDSAGGRIRVMTTHGAKGLESPIVILPDTGDRVRGRQPEIVFGGNDLPLWRMPNELRPEMMVEGLQAEKKRQSEERQRLLYVALTRAEKWLIICGSGNEKPGDESWYHQVKAGVQALRTTSISTPTGKGLRFQKLEWGEARSDCGENETKPNVAVPRWAKANVSAPEAKELVFAPSKMDGGHALSGPDNPDIASESLSKGRALHRLLEKLPALQRSDWVSAAEFYLQSENMRPGSTEESLLIEKAISILEHRKFRWMFEPSSLSEVDISAHVAVLELGRMRGTIDRLIVGENQIHIVDYKSNRTVPNAPNDVPTGILAQMGAYRMAVQEIYPDHSIEVGILWTENITYMPLPHDIVREALSKMAHLDV